MHAWLSPSACLAQCPDASAEVPEDAEDGHGKTGSKGEKAERVFIREYEAGRLLREDLVSAEEMEAVFGPFRRRARDKAQRRQRHRRRVGPPSRTHACTLLWSKPCSCMLWQRSSSAVARMGWHCIEDWTLFRGLTGRVGAGFVQETLMQTAVLGMQHRIWVKGI